MIQSPTEPPAVSAGPGDRYKVGMSSDLARVMALPQREWSEAEKEACARYLTDQLRTGAVCDRCGGSREHTPWPYVWTEEQGEIAEPGCWYTDPAHPERAKITPPLSLRPIQAVVLWELYTGARDRRTGVYMQIPVGGGKTLCFFLGALMVGAERPLLFVPANLKQDTLDAFELYAKYWKTPYPVPYVESFQQLTLAGSADMLERRAPDFLGADECDKARDLKRSTAKRIGRYIDQAREKCIALIGSGTNKRKSLRDDNHFMTWCLRERTPGALHDDALTDWCSALDEESKVGAGRLHPGALLDLADQMGVPHAEAGVPSLGMLARAREGYRRRIARTPGIVIHDVASVDVPLTINFVLASDDPEIEARFYWFRSTMMTPEIPASGAFTGIEPVLMPDALSRYRHAQELGKGFWYYWDPPPPLEWRAARKAWHGFVAQQIYTTRNCPGACQHKHCTRKPLDTEMAVANAFPDDPTLTDWRAIRSTFEPNSVPGWLSDGTLKDVVRIVHELWTAQGSTGIVWVKEQAFAQRLAAMTGWPYYGPKGERVDQYGRSVANDTIANAVSAAAKHGRKPPVVILSISANIRGRNLQAYANNLIVGWEQAGTWIEQLLGRTHRSGQTRLVSLTVLVTSGEILDSFQATLSEARFVQSQGLTQKILTATIDRSGLRAHRTGYRWLRRE